MRMNSLYNHTSSDLALLGHLLLKEKALGMQIATSCFALLAMACKNPSAFAEGFKRLCN